MLFDTINYLLYKKDKNELDNELLEFFDPYMVSRYLSFYDKGSLADYSNDTLNIYSNIFKTKEEQFLFFEQIIPKLKWSKIDYIKRPKKEEVKVGKNKSPEVIPEFYSKREIKMLLTSEY
jgi:hypothetical protein